MRLTCVGAGRLRVTDRTGGLILGTGGCQRGVVFSSEWTATAHDGRTVTITVQPATAQSATHWAMDVWTGNPVVAFAPPHTA